MKPSRILYVEDNKDAREMLQQFLGLSNGSYDVTSVGTAAEALDLASRNAFDLYILDISLPGMDGISLCRRLRERGIAQPIIFFSAMVQPADRQFCLDAGADDFLVKPHDLDRFADTVAELLSSSE
ncbi:MAG TPA: response regulator [Pyrinomonadaceae bacterium]|nr:response regulator [Pyrinomonadaceae bacterium]